MVISLFFLLSRRQPPIPTRTYTRFPYTTLFRSDTDEQPGKARPEKIALLKPAFAKAGTITAANASSISDGAAALVMTRASVAKKLDLPIVAKIVAHAAHAQEPGLFTTAPVPADRKSTRLNYSN